MLRNSVATESINNFAYEAEPNVPTDVSPEEPIFVLSSREIKAIIEKAVEPLRDEVQELRVIIDRQREDLAFEMALDRQRISRLEQKEPGPLQKDRADILRALLAANGGKMLAKEARQKMHLRKDLFSQMLKTCSDFIELKPYHLDRRQVVIILKSEFV